MKELNLKAHQKCCKLRLADLLLAEQEYSWYEQLHDLCGQARCGLNDAAVHRLCHERGAKLKSQIAGCHEPKVTTHVGGSLCISA